MDNTRLFLFAALAFVGMLMWQQWQLDYGPQPVVSTETGDTSVISQPIDDTSSTLDLPDQAEGLGTTISDDQQTGTPLDPGRLITVETDVITALIDSKGGVIRSLKLKQYPISLDQPDQGLELIHSDPDSVHIIQSGLRNR
ncbi:MAG: membrane protein insertase YidC, partial [Gammaproteobacteria bacterium]|nr:membrane protein insertase YidC [Gammaproteobacteria bacterium]